MNPAPVAMTRMNRRSARPAIQTLIIAGFLIALLLLNVAAVSAAKNTSVNASVRAPRTTITTVMPTEVFSADPTAPLVTPNPATSVKQYSRKTDTRIKQSQRDAAAAAYKDLRETYLLYGTLQPGGVGGANGLEGAAPLMDPGGVPHYFGPYPNWANSPMPMGRIANITVDTPGTFYVASTPPNVTITDAYFTGSGATATALVVGDGVRGIIVTNPGTNYTAPVVVISGPAGAGATATAHLGPPFYSGMRKFVDTLPGLNAAGANNLGNYIPVAVPDTTTYPGSDYYEIELGQFTQKMHSDLPNTTLRGYRQVNTADPTLSRFMYLGPLVVAHNGTPVRVKFINSLPIGAGGNLFIPVDTTVMGAGMGPLGMNTSPAYYTQNRGELHLHGGATPWISDGTPFQWITPANEYTSYPKGVSVYNVPDMEGGDPGPGNQTFYYTNQHSARLLFYHDHAHGITRLNVYAGEAAGYLVTDPREQDMITGSDVTGINPALTSVLPDIGIPLIIQDRTWVDNRTIAAQDPTWNWGTLPGQPMTGDLWYPHVYMPAQNPYVDTGINAFGRWHYGPWFFPPTTVAFPPVANPYFGQPGEPPMIPGTPNPSNPGEAFMDTPIVNGVAYPNVTLAPQTYRFRILNACDDRALNLQLYVADANVTTADGRNYTEVKMVPAITTPGFPADWPTDNREGGVPDPATMGPSFIQIGTEGGFLPAPVVVPNQPITYVLDPTRFDYGNVDKHAVVLMSAERADVIVDFSAYAGKTLILYNDAPAAYPAGVPQYDYYTGAPDRTDTGGAPTTQPGYGPNVRTVMQIHITNTTPAAPYNIAALNAVFAKTATKPGVFESSQPPIIIPQVAYGSAYNQVFTQNNFARIADTFKNFTTISGTQLNITFQPKALHDEMGAVYDQYGRMSAMLGLEVPSRTSVTAQFMPYGYNSPPTDVVMSSLTEAVPQLGDGTQIWRLSHNGVDSHPLHWHMFNVQVINRVGWDGFIRAPDATELGWKETVRVSPLEDTIIAIRPVAVTVPFAVPDQVRAIEATSPLGAPVEGPPGGGWFDPQGNPVTTNGFGGVLNHLVNFGWEYVWHCHILAHEEMDMMHAMAISVNDPGTAPLNLRSGEVTDPVTNTTAVFLAWRDRSTEETDWIIQRANISDPANWTDFKSVPSYTTHQVGDWAMAIDGTIPANTAPDHLYRVFAANVVGDDFAYDAGVVFPIQMRNTTPTAVNISQTIAPPAFASFTTNTTSGTVPLAVAFTDTSAPAATGWDYDFGDGNFASDNGQQNPVHVYQIPGTYTVTLTAMNTGGNATSGTTTITVSAVTPPAAPIARFNAVPLTGTAPLTVRFFSNSVVSNPAVWATWYWTFGDGTFSSLRNPVHTYTTPGVYTVSLAATNLGGTNVMTRTGFITVNAPVPSGYSVGVFRPSNRTFYLKNGSTTTRIPFGLSTDVPLSGDWNGDNMYDVGVFRPSSHIFYLKNGANLTAINFGNSTDTPITGDWNGDGRFDVGVFQNGTARFILKNGTTNTTFLYGNASDKPVTGDWNGDGLWDVGVFRPSAARFILRNGTANIIIPYGSRPDIPVTGDWNNDGRWEVGVFRISTHRFILQNGTVNQSIIFGLSTDKPITGRWS